MKDEKEQKIINIDAEDFVDIDYENNDVDTDRGTMRDRSFCVVFKNCQISMGEEDFQLLKQKIIDKFEED